ncbi:MAG: N-glycosylase/DNA lyase [Candidatus Woesearchaeota archaeon]
MNEICKINSEKELVSFLKRVNHEKIIEIEENDSQFLALKNLYNRFKNLPNLEEKFLTFIVVNALISYQLSGTGEQYWQEFSEKIDLNKNLEQAFLEFLKICKYNKRIPSSKIKRINKIKDLKLDLRFYSKEEFLELRDELEQRLSKGKTINFAVKMYGYGCRILTNKFIAFPDEIEIPLDSRILKFSKKIKNFENKKEIIEFWNKISKEVNIAPLHLDSLLWNSLGKKQL